MSPHRQLAAILVTDIEGYTAIMQQSEQRALGLREKHRQVLQREHQTHQGQIIQFYGDGTLSIFQSAVEAVRAALAMQQAFRREPRVPVRMGLHIGEIVLDEVQAIGEGVRVAACIEGLGLAGSILLSDRVNDEIAGQAGLHTILLGTYELPDIARPVEIFALDHEELELPAIPLYAVKAPAKTPPVLEKSQQTLLKSIAVLPLVNLSNDPEQEYFSNGVAEEILNSLAHIKGLKVAGRTSSFQFKGKGVDLKEVGEKLGVSTVLEGSVRKQGKRLRVTVQLVNVADGFHLWSEKYDSTLEDIFDIQDHIARAVSDKMKITLQENEPGRTARSYTRNTAAYELYLKGRYHINKRGAGLFTGIRYCLQALDLDSSFALAHAGYADGNLLAAFYGLLPPRPAMDKARQAAEAAIHLNPALCEPYCTLGFYYATSEWNWAEARNYYLKAIARNPQYGLAHSWYGLTYLAWARGDYEKAEEQGRLGIQLDPLNANAYAVYGVILHTAGKYKQTLEVTQAGLELDPEAYLCRLYQAGAYLALQQYEAALAAFDKALQVSNRHYFALNLKLITYCQMGQPDQAVLLLEELKERMQHEYVGSALIGLSEAYLGNLDAAFSYLGKACQDREPVLPTFRTEWWVPAFLRADPRFQQVLAEMAFPAKEEAGDLELSPQLSES